MISLINPKLWLFCFIVVSVASNVKDSMALRISGGAYRGCSLDFQGSLLDSYGNTQVLSQQPMQSEDSSGSEEYQVEGRWASQFTYNECFDVLSIHAFSVHFLLCLWGKASMKQSLIMNGFTLLFSKLSLSVCQCVYNIELFVWVRFTTSAGSLYACLSLQALKSWLRFVGVPTSHSQLFTFSLLTMISHTVIQRPSIFKIPI